MNPTKHYLLSIDLEDVRFRMKNGNQLPERLTDNVMQYLDFFEKQHAKVTFFTVGDVAIHNPELIKEITKKGHEIACHSLNHQHIDEHTPESFYRDVSECKEILLKAGASDVIGYRAPRFSLTSQTQWAYAQLAKAGFSYSSSVLPAKNPLYGWEGFGINIMKRDEILEIPISIFPEQARFSLPFAGGVYFRALPFWMIQYFFKKHFQKQNFCTGYFHPYDIDDQVEHFRFPEIKNALFHLLLYYNRSNTLHRLEKILNNDYRCCTYAEYISSLDLNDDK
ncbi:MAG: polysaccharide deacetylase family protein [Bacteroidota bacterium]